MAWSYRADSLDEVYHDKPGPALVSGETLTETPQGATEGKKSPKAVEGIPTQFQEFPGQNVPRTIEGDGDTKKDKEIVKAAKEQQKEDKEQAKSEKKEAVKK